MADIHSTTGARSGAGFSQRRIKRSTRVDLTPMVDLGFLLITFFVFTTTMAEPKAMNIQVPNDKDTSITDDICESCALTVVLGGNNALYYYEGLDDKAVYKQTGYGAKGLRALITSKKKAVIKTMKTDKMVLIIKPSALSSFGNLVNVIDESVINGVKRYYIAALNTNDKALAE